MTPCAARANRAPCSLRVRCMFVDLRSCLPRHEGYGPGLNRTHASTDCGTNRAICLLTVLASRSPCGVRRLTCPPMHNCQVSSTFLGGFVTRFTSVNCFLLPNQALCTALTSPLMPIFCAEFPGRGSCLCTRVLIYSDLFSFHRTPWLRSRRSRRGLSTRRPR